MKKHLYDIFHDQWYRGGTIHIISDPHFKDEDSKFFRGDSYVGDDELVKLINSKVGKKDTIIFLGDIGDVNFIKKIRGYKVLVMGNHDKGVSNYKKEKWQIAKLHYYSDNSKSFASFKLSDYSAFAIPKVMDELLNKVKKEHPDYEEGYWTWKLYDEDNHLFDEVYEGPLMINNKVILSHEPIQVPPYMFNIHGHVHNVNYKGDSQHLNVCAEVIDYTPLNLTKLLDKGLTKGIEDIHRITIDKATYNKNNYRKQYIERRLMELSLKETLDILDKEEERELLEVIKEFETL